MPIDIEMFEDKDKPVPRLEVDITLKCVAVYWCPDDFEGSDMTWDEFVGKMITDVNFAREQLIDHLLDSDVEDLLGPNGKHIENIQVRIVTKCPGR